MVNLRVIAQDVQTNNMDYFISIHSNANGDGDFINYPLLLYRGTDAAPGNGLVEAKNMGFDAWKYIAKNDITYHTAHNRPDSNNTRGDITFGGSSSTVDGFTGYYAVLKHGCDGYLSEGCFHTYHPERHRLLNKDYCRQEGARYSRAIRAWFGDNSETKGDIMGTVKDKNRTLEHSLYKYKVKTMDAYLPLNEVTVVLNNSLGQKVAEYTTDDEYNGVYVFTGLEPGTYTLVYDFPETAYFATSAEIEVVANETSFINQLVDDGTNPPYNFLDPYYPTPQQDGDIVLEDTYEFLQEYQLADVEALRGLTIRRAILRDGKYYVLAVDAEKAPKLLVLNPTTGDLIKEMSTEGLETNGHGGKKIPYILSDISFTTDGVLIGANSTVFGVEGNAFITGDFCIYKWQASSGGVVEDAAPQVIHRTAAATGADISHVGNNRSNFVANTIAVKGNLEDFYIFFDSHAGAGWNTTYGMNWVCWRMTNEARTGSKVNYINTAGGGYTETMLGEDFRMTYSPLGDIDNKDDDAELYRFIIDGTTIKPTEIKMTWEADAPTKEEFSEDITLASNGANYFRYLDRVFMAAPVCEESEGRYSYKAYLYDITDGLAQAKNIGVTDAVITDQPALTYMASAGVVDNANIDLYLMVNNNIVKYRSKDIVVSKQARIFASDLESVKTASGYTISYILNDNAKSAELILIDAESGVEEKSIALTGLTKGQNVVNVPSTDIPSNGKFTWAIKVSANSVKGFVKLSDDSELYRFFGPKGIAIDKSPDSKYFGRVYVTNSDAGTTSGRATYKGVYVLGSDGSDVTNQGNNAYAGGITWDNAVAGESPRKVAVAADGRVFISDHSKVNSGIYYMNPETFDMASLFPGATRETTYGNLKIGSTFVAGRTPAIGVRGTGANTQIYAVDASSADGNAGWKKHVTFYNLGESNVLDKAPEAFIRKNSYVANENAGVVPVEGGFWAAQFRGAGGETIANPCMYYHSDAADMPVFNTADAFGINAASSQNGGLAVNEKEKIVALSNAGGVSVYSYVMSSEGVPTVTEMFSSNLESSGVTYDDFDFDYAGNLYAVSYSGKLVSVWAMPTSDNTCIVPAQKSMLIEGGIVGIKDNTVQSAKVKVYPNPTTSYVTVESPVTINSIEVYSVAGSMVNTISNVNAMSATVDFSDLAKGVYFIKVNGRTTIKVVKR